MRRLPEILQSCWNDGRACRTLQHRAAHRDREICCEPWIVPIPGTTKLKHLEENFGAANVELTPDDVREIDSAAWKITVQGGRYPGHLEKRTGR